MILTPEKLDFLLRYDQEFAKKIGLIIYDEGHLFDNETRGAKYELLLSSLKGWLIDGTQVVLISAVIANAQEVKNWLLGQEGVLVDGKNLSPTNRSIAFVDWTQRNRFLQFVDDQDINRSLFFVPTVLQSHEIRKKGKERTPKYFPVPDKDGLFQSSQIAGYLACRLAVSGLAAVFVGQKKSAQKVVRDLVWAYDRNLPIEKPLTYSEDLIKAKKIISYIKNTLGEDTLYSEAAKLGILLHHAGIPHGLRLVTENALQESYFKMVVCTSTLAQGVNLPIRYLIVATDHQGRERIKIRDFHNLMGRAGRSGKYTEGTVIFSNPEIYKGRFTRTKSYKWNGVSNMLNSNNSEPSRSRLLILLDSSPEDPDNLIKWQTEVDLIRKEVSSYLITALTDVEDVHVMDRIVRQLVHNTLAYFQLDSEEKKAALASAFLEIGLSIMADIPDATHRKIFSKSILNIQQSKEFVVSLRDTKEECLNPESNLLAILWSELYKHSKNFVLQSFSAVDSLILCRDWIQGTDYPSILGKANKMQRNSSQQLEMGQIIDLCENGFSYGLSTLLGSFSELSKLVFDETEISSIRMKLAVLQKNLKYGVPNTLEPMIYELGFADRNLAIEIAQIINVVPKVVLSKNEAKNRIQHSDLLREHISINYPEYFLERLNQLAVSRV